MTVNQEDSASLKRTRSLLLCGIFTAPLFYAVVLVQAFTRVGFNIKRAPLSLLSLGDLGWIQIANFIITGLLALVCARGVRRALAGSKGGTWGPVLISTYGLGLILAGIFHPDPGYDFPPGVGAPPEMLPTMSRHASIHSAGFMIVMLSLILACFVFVRAFRSRGEGATAFYSAATGIVVPALLAFAILTNITGLILVVGGLAFGIENALLFTRFIQSSLYSVAPNDPITFTLIPLLVLSVASRACLLPALKASRVDPAAAIRNP